MIRLRRYSIFLPAVFLAAAPAANRAPERRPITDTDLFKFVWAADPQISPNGSQVVFVRVNVNEDKDRYEMQIFVVPADGSAPPRPLTSGRGDRSPRWSPNGREIAFVRTPEPVDGKSQQAQIYLISMDGGEARALTSAAKGASSPVWSPDGHTIAFSSTPDTSSSAAKADSAKRAADTAQKKHVSDVRVITRAQYRWNGGGYTDVAAHSHIWTVPASIGPTGALPTLKQITFGNFDEGVPAWARDGSRLYFTSDRHLEPYYETTGEELYSVPANGGAIAKVASIDGQIGSIAPSPDGKRIAFTGSVNAKPLRFFDQNDLFVVDATPGSQPRNLTAGYDFDVEGELTADQHPPRAGAGGGIIWSRDGKSLVVVTTENGRANLKRFSSSDGTVDSITTGDHDVVAYTASADGSKIVTLVSTPVNIGDLFVVDAIIPRATPRQITRVNEGLFSTLDLSAPEEFWYKSFDGRRIQGWILKPPGFDASKKYPLILEIHGGPNAAYGFTFTHEFDWMAAKGYVVLYTNPRGSTSYGQDFANIIQFHYPGDDYKDLMAGIDEVLKRGYADSTRMAVTGGSGGGVLTNWVVTHTSRFAAAASQRSIADWSGFWYSADFTLFHPTWFSGSPWENSKQFAELSPITYVANVTTPLMLIEGESDMRTPPAMGGEQMFRALKYLHKPTVMVRFPEETHELSRSGKPWHRVERLRHIVGWFDKYLQHQTTTVYDVR
ncbi:MAG: S9 family peptidase [Gemmatimonadota bacterium]|nr:S9 family peptidase [Gemmatimonadota bacterium]